MTLRTRVAAAVAVVLLALTAVMLRTVLIPAALGGVFGALLQPVHRFVSRRLGRRRAAFSPPIVLFLAIVLVLLPVAFIAFAALRHLRALLGEGFSERWDALQKSLQGPLARVRGWGETVGIDASGDSIMENVPGALKSVARHAGEALAATPAMLLSTFIFLLAVYFFVRDGEAFARYVSELSPFTAKHTKAFMKTTHDAIRGAVLASIVSGLVQAVLVFLSQLMFGVPGVVLWSVSAFVLSFLPMIGTMPITIGSTLYLFFTGHVGAGVGMAIAALMIGVSDNFVRPWVQGADSEMHPLITLLAIFGGLELFGGAGVFLGPVVAAMALWCFQTYLDSVGSATSA